VPRAVLCAVQAALAKEVHWLTSLNHPNLVRFCAVCLERPLVVMEFYKVRLQPSCCCCCCCCWVSACFVGGLLARPLCHTLL
jgi:hypothetical protein